jgi:hypothetical protein
MAISPYNDAWRTGEDNHTARMSNAEARAARILRDSYRPTVQELATMYGVSRAAMSNLLRGITYADAGGPLAPGRMPPGTHKGRKRSHGRYADVKS